MLASEGNHDVISSFFSQLTCHIHAVGTTPSPCPRRSTIFRGSLRTTYNPQFFQIIYLFQEYLLPVDVINRRTRPYRRIHRWENKAKTFFSFYVNISDSCRQQIFD